MPAFDEGAPCWADVALPDLAAGKRFYGELFGWDFEDQGEDFGHYTLALRDGKAAAGLMPAPDPAAATGWTVYLASPDAKAAAARVAEAGGRLLFGPDGAGESGVMAGAADPTGALFGVWQAGGLQGFGVTEVPGSFCWAETWTREPAEVDRFYGAVFGYRAEQVGDGQHFDYTVWSLPSDPARKFGGRLALGADTPGEVPEGFRVYFAVADCDAAVAAVRRLGGKVPREPQDSPQGRVAFVTDDRGTPFTIIDRERKVGSMEGS
ncbi:VOC family protein [Streptomyces sp. NRRL F-5123]|uniref:VOC family protein n=1 Tax=Streptomyces sp. NRRL F-5123 TaxID=1463856 RepID=UPI0004E1FBA9|nr:VOC family protein [Streptomyces sp. NRRL F-5123]